MKMEKCSDKKIYRKYHAMFVLYLYVIYIHMIIYEVYLFFQFNTSKTILLEIFLRIDK